MVGFRSWTLTPLIDFENERLLLYFLSFLLGALFYRQDVFAEKPRGKRLYYTVNGIAWIPVTAHIFVRLIPFFSAEGFTVTPMYRLMWWVSFDLALLCMLYLMIETFRRYFDKTGKIWSELNRNFVWCLRHPRHPDRRFRHAVDENGLAGWGQVPGADRADVCGQ